jgi:hypothetical protein
MNNFSASHNSSEPLLPPMLGEFRAALKDEIEVAKRNPSGGAIALSNGHKICQQGSFYHYSFSIDSVLDAPDEAPGDLIVPGKARMEAKKLSGEGLHVVIGVAHDLGAFVPTATGPESQCPICGSEMVAAEGLQDPFYWRCVNDGCYSRSIGQPYPFDGMLRCSSGSCNSAVEFGYRGDEPHWRCIENKHHRQKIFKSHLRLPKMAALIPKKEYKKVCKLLGIETFGEISTSLSIPQAQMDLFDKVPGSVGPII